MRNTIVFKSNGIFFHKEKRNWKRNTCRKVEAEDFRWNELIRIVQKGPSTNDYIRIINVDTKESFLRKIQDVSLWEGIFIISW